MNRRRFLVQSTLAAGGAAAVTQAIAQAPALPTIRWRCASSFPKSLDTIYGGGETIAKRVEQLTGGKFQIRVFAAGEIHRFLSVGRLQHTVAEPFESLFQ